MREDEGEPKLSGAEKPAEESDNAAEKVEEEGSPASPKKSRAQVDAPQAAPASDIPSGNAASPTVL